MNHIRNSCCYVTLIACSMSLVALSGCDGELASEVSIPEVAIQAAVDAYMPVKGSDYVQQQIPAEITITEGNILLESGRDQIGIELIMHVDLPSVELPALRERPNRPGPPVLPPLPAAARQAEPDTSGKSIDGSVIVFVSLRYEPSEAAFYCENAKTEKIQFGKLPDGLGKIVSRVSETAMNKYFADNSVYKLDDQQAATRWAKATLQNVTIKDGNLIAKIGI